MTVNTRKIKKMKRNSDSKLTPPWGGRKALQKKLKNIFIGKDSKPRQELHITEGDRLTLTKNLKKKHNRHSGARQRNRTFLPLSDDEEAEAAETRSHTGKFIERKSFRKYTQSRDNKKIVDDLLDSTTGKSQRKIAKIFTTRETGTYYSTWRTIRGTYTRANTYQLPCLPNNDKEMFAQAAMQEQREIWKSKKA
ncbi:hypothetical protein J6590_022998 [Homalodisca vitripennis]|nr:hypothetical protein J6590_022998 [Homalodisca vitripennis]